LFSKRLAAGYSFGDGYGMETQPTDSNNRKFTKVLDGRKQPVRCLWKRDGFFYAQLNINGRQTKQRLAALTTADAVKALNALKVDRARETLRIVHNAPNLAKAIVEYKASGEFDGKRSGTQTNETGYFKHWEAVLGNLRVDRITGPDIVRGRDKLAKAGKTARTCNLYVGALMQVLKFCHERGQLARLPEFKRLKQPNKPRRNLVTDEEFQSLLDACRPEITANADLMRFFFRFLALTGAREAEATRVRWRDVSIEGRKVTIGADGKSKNGETRDVNASDELVELLREMATNRPPDSEFLFPSPQRGKGDRHITNVRASLIAIRTEAGLGHIAFHDMRHLFISKCVMAGVPIMTIAEWAGHKDRGVLVSKVYGHVSQDHKAEMAKRLSLFKTPDNVLPLSATA
jgi:integrase